MKNNILTSDVLELFDRNHITASLLASPRGKENR